MLRIPAHCVHVLTMPFEKLMAVQRRTFYARANKFGGFSADDFLRNYNLFQRRVYSPAYCWKAHDTRKAMIQTKMSSLHVEMSELAQK